MAVHKRGSRGWAPDYTQLGVFDVNTLELVDSLQIDAGAGFIHFRWAEPTRDGRMLYLLGADPLGPAAYAYSVRERRITFRTSLYSAFGRIRLSPDQRELWVTDPGPSPVFGAAWPGHILILDASTGAILDTIHTRGLDDESPDTRWRVDNIQFVPDLNKAYVNCSYWGPILVINTESKEITKSLLYDQLRFGASIVVLPRY